MNEITMDKKYKTRSGKDVRILCVYAPGYYPVVGYQLKENGYINPTSWTSDGRYDKYNKSNSDLIEVEEKKTFWMNIYPDDPVVVMHNSRKEADIRATSSRIACIKREYTEGEGLEW